MFQCPNCSFSTKRKFSLNRHIRGNKCLSKSRVEKRFICAKCTSSYTRKYQLKRHIQLNKCEKVLSDKPKPKPRPRPKPNVRPNPDISRLHFDNIDDFILWKVTEEQKTLSKFSQVCGKRKTKNGRKRKFICHRAGYVRVEDPSIRKRSLKRKGSCKINGHCTAYILCEENDDGNINVEYNNKHCNHDMEMKHLPISSIDKISIAGKLTEGVPLNQILEDIRQTIPDTQTVTRTQLITKHELHNIAAEFKIPIKGRLSNIDTVSVEMLIEQYNEKFGEATPFRYYKQQNVDDDNEELAKEDLLLVIMDKIQIQNMIKFGPEKICIDSTHSTTGNDFILTSILVVNDLDMGVPVAYAISNKENVTFMRKFFEVVKENCGVIATKTFMSDDIPAYVNAWRQVMETPQNILLCTWLVDKNWRKNLNKISSRSSGIQKEVYQLVRSCMEETDETCFPSVVDKAVETLLSYPETIEFGNYFQREYSSRYRMWAFAFRKYIGLNTNMKLEALHRELKSVYFSGIKNGRLDALIVTLLTMNLNKEHSRVTRLVMDTDTHTLRKIRQRHDEGIRISRDDVSILDQKTATVKSQSNRASTYTVTRVKDECNCKLCCNECNNICIHFFECTCVDNTVSHNLCKHIHAVAKIQAENDEIVFPLNVDPADVDSHDNTEVFNMIHYLKSRSTTAKKCDTYQCIKSAALSILHIVEKLEEPADEDVEKALILIQQAKNILEMKVKNAAMHLEKTDESSTLNKRFENQVRFTSPKMKGGRKTQCLSRVNIRKFI